MRDEGSRSLKKEGSFFDEMIIKHEHQAPSNVDYQWLKQDFLFLVSILIQINGISLFPCSIIDSKSVHEKYTWRKIPQALKQ